MKTLADFKRALTIGSKWQAYHVLNQCDLGVREVVAVNTVGVTFAFGDNNLTYLDFPKSNEIKFVGDEVHIYWLGGANHVLTYKKVG